MTPSFLHWPSRYTVLVTVWSVQIIMCYGKRYHCPLHYDVLKAVARIIHRCSLFLYPVNGGSHSGSRMIHECALYA